MIICYTVPEIRLVADVSVTLHFGLIFALLPHPDSSKNQNSKNKQKRKKTKKIPGEIIILRMGTKHYYQMMYGS